MIIWLELQVGNMIEYPKINSIYKRDDKGKFIIGDYSQPEFEYLSCNLWEATEKIDGTNIRIMWNQETVAFGGKTNNAQIPTHLIKRLQELFPVENFKKIYPELSLTLYGEGYGAKIQKGGGNYIKDGCDFILFDVLVGDWWLKREDILDVANKLQIKIVPPLGYITLQQAMTFTQTRIKSSFGNFPIEGIVLKPRVELKDRKGNRIITKVKCKDWK